MDEFVLLQSLKHEKLLNELSDSGEIKGIVIKTKQEYELLTTQEKNNGKFYFVVD